MQWLHNHSGHLIGVGRDNPSGCLQVVIGRNQDMIAHEMIDALSRADQDWVRENYADDFRIWVTGSLPFSGENDKAGALESMPSVLDLFPQGLQFTIQAMTAEGDRVAIEATSSGKTFRGDPYEQEYHFLMRARDGKIIMIASEGDSAIASVADDVFLVPRNDPLIDPILSTIPLQLIAYHIADLNGTDVDQPRNLAKSVTVE